MLTALHAQTGSALASARHLSAAAAPAPKYDSVWALMQSRPDLRSYTSMASYFPDLMLRLSDPELSLTLLLPSDASKVTFVGACRCFPCLNVCDCV